IYVFSAFSSIIIFFFLYFFFFFHFIFFFFFIATATTEIYTPAPSRRQRQMCIRDRIIKDEYYHILLVQAREHDEQ
ncbi:hypothetical protein, partial [Escherichia coli]|uniref:hypothetical protein n=1 Tax=Escherichia coli TaxID=562 RepID=UPI001BC88CAA